MEQVDEGYMLWWLYPSVVFGTWLVYGGSSAFLITPPDKKYKKALRAY